MSFTDKRFTILDYLKRFWKSIIIVSVPLLLLPLAISGNKALQCSYVMGVVSMFWITEVLDLAVTSLIPIVLLPALGILTPTKVASCYMKEVTLMLVGGLIVAKAIEEQNLHKRLALRILKFMGPNIIFQYLGFMISTWFLSMWISNTATAAMMITLADAVIQQWNFIEGFKDYKNNASIFGMVNIHEAEETFKKVEEEEALSSKSKSMEINAKGLLLGISYSAACGGIATIFGTSTNIVFYGAVDERYGSKFNLNFITFMMFSLPISVIILIVAWVVLSVRYIGINSIFKRKINPLKDKISVVLVNDEYRKLGGISYGEISILTVFCFMVILWVIREPGIPLWSSLFIYKNKNGESKKYWSDAVTAILSALLVFILPAKNPFSRSSTGEKLVTWKSVERNFSWTVVFLFGGGFALAAGFEESGLSSIIGRFMNKLDRFPHFVIILLVSLGISFLTELTSNLATATIVLPIVFKMAECIKMHPMIIGLTATLACSFSFCLPAANPPNAIVFSTGKLRVLDMVTSGLILNMLCVIVLSIMTYYYSAPIFHTNIFPDWINANCTKT